MFAALSWLLDLRPAHSSGSSSDEDSDSDSNSTCSSDSGNNTALPHTVLPTTFTNARGQPVAELHLSSAQPTQYFSQGSGLRRDSQQENSLFADLHAQSSTFFTAAAATANLTIVTTGVDACDDASFSATSPQTTVPVWNLSTYTSDTVSVSPLPSPAYGQAPTNPAAAFYSLAEHGSVVVTPPLGTATIAAAATTTTAAATKLPVGRTLLMNDGVVLSANFPTAETTAVKGSSTFMTVPQRTLENDSEKAPKGRGQTAATRGGRTLPAATSALRIDTTPPYTSVSPGYPAEDAAAASADAAAYVFGDDVAVLTPQTRILEWDQEVRERRGSAEEDVAMTDHPSDDESSAEVPLPFTTPILTTTTAAVPAADTLQRKEVSEEGSTGRGGEESACASSAPEYPPPLQASNAATEAASTPGPFLPLPSAGHVVQLHPSNPFLRTADSDAAAIPQLLSDLSALPTASARPPPIDVGQPASSLRVKAENGNDPAVLTVSVHQADFDGSADVGDAYEFMQRRLRQRTEELLSEGRATTAPEQAKTFVSTVRDAAAMDDGEDRAVGEVVQLGDGFVTLTAMEAHAPHTPPHKSAARAAPVFDFSPA